MRNTNPVDSAVMAFGFDLLFELQLDLQINAFQIVADDLPDEERADFLRWNFLAMLDEAHEALQEVGWKPWAESRHVHTERIAEEFVDMLHFFANICLASGVTGQMLADGYLKKRQRNEQRQLEGYDGVKEKCQRCHRDYEEIIAEQPALGVKYRTRRGTIVCRKCYIEIEAL